MPRPAKIVGGLVVAGLLVLGLATLMGRSPRSVGAIPQPPHIFFGVVTANGTPVGAGIKIEARINNINYALKPGASTQSTFTHGLNSSGFNYGSSENFQVCADDLGSVEREGGVDGDTVTFYLDDRPATTAQAVKFKKGSVEQVDLDYDPTDAAVAATASANACGVATPTPTPTSTPTPTPVPGLGGLALAVLAGLFVVALTLRLVGRCKGGSRTAPTRR